MQQRRCPPLRWAVAGVHMLYVYLMISMLLKRCVPFLSGSRRRGTALFARMRAAEAPPREAAARSPGEAAARFPMTEVDGEANTEMPKPMRVRFREDDAKELTREHCDVGEDVAAEKPKRRSATPRPRLRKSSAVAYGGNVWREVVIMDRPSILAINPTKMAESELAAPPWALWRHVERREARSTRSASPRGRSASPRVRLRR